MKELLQVEHLSKAVSGFYIARHFFLSKAWAHYGTDRQKRSRQSTTLKSILNMVRPESGTVTMLGKDFMRMKRNVSRTSALCLEGLTFIR